MKKYLISTLTAAAAMAVPAFADATLLGSWDFSRFEDNTTGSLTSTSGSLTLVTGDSVSDGNLVITTSTANDNETTISLSDQSISVTEGISVVITLTDWNFIAKGNILASLSTGTVTDYVAAGLTTGEGGSLSGSGSKSFWGAANGSDGNFNITTSGDLTFEADTATTIIITFIGNTVSLYQDGELIGSGTFSSGYDADATIKDVAIGSWDRNSVNSEPGLTISSLEIWKGDVTTLPEPSMFGLMFGLGAIGLVATRRRRKVA